MSLGTGAAPRRAKAVPGRRASARTASFRRAPTLGAARSRADGRLGGWGTRDLIAGIIGRAWFGGSAGASLFAGVRPPLRGVGLCDLTFTRPRPNASSGPAPDVEKLGWPIEAGSAGSTRGVTHRSSRASCAAGARWSRRPGLRAAFVRYWTGYFVRSRVSRQRPRQSSVERTRSRCDSIWPPLLVPPRRPRHKELSNCQTFPGVADRFVRPSPRHRPHPSGLEPGPMRWATTDLPSCVDFPLRAQADVRFERVDWLPSCRWRREYRDRQPEVPIDRRLARRFALESLANGGSFQRTRQPWPLILAS